MESLISYNTLILYKNPLMKLSPIFMEGNTDIETKGEDSTVARSEALVRFTLCEKRLLSRSPT